MKIASTRSLAVLGTVLGGLSLLLAAGGCAGGPAELREPPSTGEVQEKSLAELKERLISNDAAFLTLTADCQAAITSPLLRQPPQLNISGKLMLEKPGKIRLKLSGPGQTYIELVGNGEEYVVRMPIFRNLPYSGKYDEPIKPVADRIHFMPDDLAQALNMMSLLEGKTQVLKAYPRRWDIVAGDIQNPVVYPPTWTIDSIVAAGEPEVGLKVLNSILIDRTTEEVLRLDKFRWDGSLRTRIWYSEPTTARKPDGEPVRVPGELLIWYPYPLEGTLIRLRLTNHKVHVPVPADAFDLRK